MSNDNTIYSYEDCFMYFRFGDVYSKQYNLFITNNNDRTIINGIGASTTFEAAAYQEGTYLVGTKSSQKTFKRKCAAKGISLAQYKEMMVWLTPGTTGKLTFDSDIDWSWNVVLDTVGDATVFGDNENMVVEFEITWKTVGSYLATTTFDASLTLGSDDKTAINNKYGIPLVQMFSDYNDSNPSLNYTIQMIVPTLGNAKQYISYINTLFTFPNAGTQHIPQLERKLSANGITYSDTKLNGYLNNITRFNDIGSFTGGNFQYYGQYNLTTFNNTLIGKLNICDYDLQNKGIMELKGRAPLVISATGYTINATDSSFQLTINDPQVSRYLEYNEHHQLKTFFCLAQIESVNSNAYDSGLYNDQNYPLQFTSVLFTDDTTSIIENTRHGRCTWDTAYNNIVCNFSARPYNWDDYSPTKQHILTVGTFNNIQLNCASKTQQQYTQTMTATVQSYNNL